MATKRANVETVPTMTAERLTEFGEAWNRHDPDALMAYMADDCSYQTSFGPDLEGSNYEGWDAVREGFARFFARYPDGAFGDSRVFVTGDRGASEWTFTATGPDGVIRGYRPRRRVPLASCERSVPAAGQHNRPERGG